MFRYHLVTNCPTQPKAKHSFDGYEMIRNLAKFATNWGFPWAQSSPIAIKLSTLGIADSNQSHQDLTLSWQGTFALTSLHVQGSSTVSTCLRNSRSCNLSQTPKKVQRNCVLFEKVYRKLLLVINLGHPIGLLWNR